MDPATVVSRARGPLLALALCALLSFGARAAPGAAAAIPLTAIAPTPPTAPLSPGPVATTAAAAATPAPAITMHVAFAPERLGHGTTVHIAIAVATEPIPPPLSELDILYPSDLGVTTSGLGINDCSQARLEAQGPADCPADSRMGEGSVLAEIPVGAGTVSESGGLSIVRGPERGGHLALLFYVQESEPLNAQVTLSSLLLPATAPFEQIQIAVPPVQSLPEAPDVSVVALDAVIGPRGLTYQERVGGRLVAYHPEGVILPRRCPRGGFPFAAVLTFLGGTRSEAHTTVACPATSAPRR